MRYDCHMTPDTRQVLGSRCSGQCGLPSSATHSCRNHSRTVLEGSYRRQPEGFQGPCTALSFKLQSCQSSHPPNFSQAASSASCASFTPHGRLRPGPPLALWSSWQTQQDSCFYKTSTSHEGLSSQEASPQLHTGRHLEQGPEGAASSPPHPAHSGAWEEWCNDTGAPCSHT